MNPRTYEHLRNRLIALMEKAAGIGPLDTDARNLLTGICRKILENRFEIVLAGEFQGGKSTTFNALCDGRELSPMGSGIRTSGCILSARNLADPDAPEAAVVQWKSGPELCAGFSDLLLPHLQHLDSERFGKKSAPELLTIMNLDNERDRKLLRKAVEREWQIWKKDRAAYDPEQKGSLDILRAAALVAEFWNHPALARLQNRKFTPDDAGRMAAFPEDWELRWAGGGPENFRVEEIAFIFIRRISFLIHSENLSRLGCVITDCPGLFASRWDTEIARQAMSGADAILYLFDGSKTLKLSDLRALRFVRSGGMAHKLFYGCNMRGHSLNNSRRILRASVSSLASSGFDISDSDVTLFHALLALRSVQAVNFPEKAISLRGEMARYMAVLDPDAAENSGNHISARDPGRLDRLLAMVEGRILARKARSVLVENGAKVAAGCLAELEGSLKARETVAFRQEKVFREQVAEVEAGLKKFRSDCAVMIARLDRAEPDHAMADDLWNRLEAQQADLCRHISERIYSEVVSGFSMSLLIRKQFGERITRIIRDEIDACFTGTIHAWTSDIREGKHAVYNREIARRVRLVSRELKQIWEDSVLSGMELVAGTAIPEFSGNMVMDTGNILQGLAGDHAFENVRYSALLAAGGVTGIFTATSGVLMAVYILITRLFWVRIATVVAFVVNIILAVLTKGLIEKSLKEDIHRKLSPAIDLLFHEIRDGVKTEIRKFSSDIRAFYRQMFTAATERPRQVFESRKQQAEADFLRSREARVAIAWEARQVREEKIQPLRAEIEAFCRDVDAETGGSLIVKLPEP